jgi:predicted metal-dependent phosphoesterase TrpH
MLVDLHVYTSASGGRPLDQVIAEARSFGLDGVAIVDRRSSGDTVAALAKGAAGDFPVFVGVEIETRDGDAIVFVPRVDPFLSREEWRQLLTLDKPRLTEVKALVEREGGVVLLAHPYDRTRAGAPRDRVFAVEGADAFEVGNDTAEPRDTRTAMEALAAGRLAAFGGSAARGRARGGSRWATLFASPVANNADLVAALRGGNYWAVEIGAPGEQPRPREERAAGGPPAGDRGPRPGGDRGPRPGGDRGPRPGGGGGPRRDRR